MLWVCALAWATLPGFAADIPQRPQLVGDWWQITHQPDLGALSTSNQQPVDFGIWQSADTTWHVWSCIRATKEPGHTRLLYHWEGQHLTDTDWAPKGIAMQAEAKFGELPGGLQAPYVFQANGVYEMFYGGWEAICSATSSDGRTFARKVDAEGKTTLFSAPPDYHQTRDPMVIRIGELWYCYFSANTETKGADFCRTSPDLKTWSDVHVVAEGGQSGSGPVSAECPFVVEPVPGEFYLFRTQHYGTNQQTSVYFSRDPLDFGIDHDEGHFVGTLPVAAPEVFKYEGQYYIAALLPSLNGIHISRLNWEKTP